MAAPAEPPVDELAALLYEDFEATEVPRLAAEHAAHQQALADEETARQDQARAEESAAAAKRALYQTPQDPRNAEFLEIMAKHGLEQTSTKRTLKPGQLFKREAKGKKVLRVVNKKQRMAEAAAAAADAEADP